MTKRAMATFTFFTFILGHALSSCNDVLKEEKNQNHINTNLDTSTNIINDTQAYEQLLESVSIEVLSNLNCTASQCHSGETAAKFKVVNSTNKDVEKAIFNYIAQSNPINIVNLKQKPTALLPHAGSENIILTDSRLTLNWYSLVDQASNKLDRLTSPVVSLITESNCTQCHGDKGKFGSSLTFGSPPDHASIQLALSNLVNVSNIDVLSYPYDNYHTGKSFANAWSIENKQQWGSFINAL